MGRLLFLQRKRRRFHELIDHAKSLKSSNEYSKKDEFLDEFDEIEEGIKRLIQFDWPGKSNIHKLKKTNSNLEG